MLRSFRRGARSRAHRMLLGIAAIAAAALAAGCGQGTLADEQTDLGTPRASAPAFPALGAPGNRGSELKSERTATSKTFEGPFGSRIVEVHAEPIHYRTEDGEWRAIDNHLTAAGDGLTNRANSYDAFVPDDLSEDPVRLTNGGRWVSFAPVGVTDAEPTISGADGSTATYDDALGGATVRYRVKATSVKEEIVLERSSEAAPITFAVDASDDLRVSLDDSLTTRFTDAAGKEHFSFAPPTAVDAAGVSAPRDQLTYTLVKAGSGWEVRLEVARAWLDDPARRWPVTIDPTAYVSGAEAWCTIRSDDGGTSGCHNPNGTLSVGHDAGGEARGLLRFDIPALDESYGADLLSAELTLRVAGAEWMQGLNPDPAKDIGLFRATTEWDEAATWATPLGSGPGWTTAGGDFAPDAISHGVTDSGSTTFADLRDLVQGWTDGTIPNHGVVLKETDPGIDNRVEYAAAAPDPVPPVLRLSYVSRFGVSPQDSFETIDVDAHTKLDVNLANGNLVYQQTDIDPVTANGVPFTRVYNSLWMGFAWRWGPSTISNYEAILGVDGDTGVLATSTGLVFFSSNGGTWSAQQAGWTLTEGGTPTARTFTASRSDGTTYEFDQPPDENGEQVWAATRLVDSEGRSLDMDLTWFLLNQATDEDGGTTVLQPGAGLSVASVAGPGGQEASYTYGEEDPLPPIATVTGPGAAETTLDWDTHGMLTGIHTAAGEHRQIVYGPDCTPLDPATCRVMAVAEPDNDGICGGPILLFGFIDDTVTVFDTAARTAKTYARGAAGPPTSTTVLTADPPCLRFAGSLYTHREGFVADGVYDAILTGEPHGTGTDSGVQSLMFQVDGDVKWSERDCPRGGCTMSKRFLVDTADLTEGYHRVLATATNRGSNGDARFFGFFVDRSAPTVDLSGDLAPANRYLWPGIHALHVDAREGTREAPGSGVEKVSLTIDGESAGLVERECAKSRCAIVEDFDVDVDELDDGPHRFVLKATDKLGHTWRKAWTMETISTKPALTLSGPLYESDGEWIKRGSYPLDLVADGNGGDPLDEVSVKIDDVELDPTVPLDEEPWSVSAQYDFRTDWFDDGEHEVAVNVSDTGEREAHETWSVKVDNTLPTVELSGTLIGGGILTDPSYSLIVDATDTDGFTPSSGVAQVDVLVDGRRVDIARQSCGFDGCGLTHTYTYVPADHGPGEHVVMVVARDGAGNEKRTQFSAFAPSETSAEEGDDPPTLAVDGELYDDRTQWVGLDVYTIDFTVDDYDGEAAHAQLLVDGGTYDQKTHECETECEEWSSTLTVDAEQLSQGEHTISVLASDTDGAVTRSWEVKLDKTAPRLSIGGELYDRREGVVYSGHGTYRAEATAIDGSANRLESGMGVVELTIDGAVFGSLGQGCMFGSCDQSAGFELNPDLLTSGVHTAEITAYDLAGNSTAVEFDVTAGGPAPTPSSTGAPFTTREPELLGNPAIVGDVLSASEGTWSGALPIETSVQWQRCDETGGTCVDIAGATRWDYEVTSSDIGHRLRAEVSAENADGTQVATTPAGTLVVADPIAAGDFPSPSGEPPPIAGPTLVASEVSPEGTQVDVYTSLAANNDLCFIAHVVTDGSWTRSCGLTLDEGAPEFAAANTRIGETEETVVMGVASDPTDKIALENDEDTNPDVAIFDAPAPYVSVSGGTRLFVDLMDGAGDLTITSSEATHSGSVSSRRVAFAETDQWLDEAPSEP